MSNQVFSLLAGIVSMSTLLIYAVLRSYVYMYRHISAIYICLINMGHKMNYYCIYSKQSEFTFLHLFKNNSYLFPCLLSMYLLHKFHGKHFGTGTFKTPKSEYIKAHLVNLVAPWCSYFKTCSPSTVGWQNHLYALLPLWLFPCECGQGCL